MGKVSAICAYEDLANYLKYHCLVFIYKSISMELEITKIDQLK